MAASRITAIVEDPRYLDHAGPPGHPERPDRLAAVREAVESRTDALTPLPSRAADPDEILRVHGRSHLETVEKAAERAPGHLDPDTYVSPQSFEVARLAAGGSVDLARRVARGEADSGLAAVRPPGHHAEANRAMGFCLFNNVAIAARALQAEEGLERLLILDWDVHHGNGTQHSFEADPTVLYFSAHQFPYYPGTGDFGEIGVGAGEGATLNVPLPAGCGDAEYVGVMQRVLAPAARTFEPEMILVSSGFDAHRDDPLAAMQVTRQGFRDMAAVVRSVADDVCGGRIACILEGGYAHTGLLEGTDALLEVLVDSSPSLPDSAPLEPGSTLERVVGRVTHVHAGRFPEIGSA